MSWEQLRGEIDEVTERMINTITASLLEDEKDITLFDIYERNNKKTEV